MPQYTITESVGSRVERVTRFEDLEKHHPSSGREPGRHYETVDGELEEVRRLAGRTYVKKDFILSQDEPGPVFVPAPVNGYVHYLHDATNAVRIYDRPFGTPGAVMLAQSLHMEPGTSPAEGAFVAYGEPLGQMGDTGSPGSVHAHVEVEVDQFRRYIDDIAQGVIRPGLVDPLADGVLRQGEQGAAVETLQRALNREGAHLEPDGDFGRRTRNAVEDYQRRHGLQVDGVAGAATLAALGVPLARAETPPTAPAASSAPPVASVSPAAVFGPTPLSNLIGSGEGGYNSYNRGRAGDAQGRELDFVHMTVAEVMRRQALPHDDPDYLFAVGKFQMIPGTMRETVHALGIDPSACFSPELQERMFADYLVDEKRPTVRAYITGDAQGGQGLRDAQIALAYEFASVADPRTGRSYYDNDSAGNSASISADQIAAALEAMRAQYQEKLASALGPTDAYRALSGAAPVQDPLRDGALRQGEQGEPVRELQAQLNRLGARGADGRPLVADGDFGARTREAVQAFQRKHDLPDDGVAGPLTLAAMAAALARAPTSGASAPGVQPPVMVPPDHDTTLRSGDRGPDVERLQAALHLLGYRGSENRPLQVDGEFGPATEAAVRAFQRAHGLVEDGAAGPRALGALARAELVTPVSDSRHPDHALYRQAYEGLQKIGAPALGLHGEESMQRAAATLAHEAKVTGLARIDHVVKSGDGTGLFAVQGGPSDPAHLRVHVDRAQAVQQPIEVSTQRIDEERHARTSAQGQAMRPDDQRMTFAVH